jgi:hypothetical protein
MFQILIHGFPVGCVLADNASQAISNFRFCNPHWSRAIEITAHIIPEPACAYANKHECKQHCICDEFFNPGVNYDSRYPLRHNVGV